MLQVGTYVGSLHSAIFSTSSVNRAATPTSPLLRTPSQDAVAAGAIPTAEGWWAAQQTARTYG